MRGIYVPQTRKELPSLEGGARVVSFILYIIVAVEFHLDTTNTLLFSRASDRAGPRR